MHNLLRYWKAKKDKTHTHFSDTSANMQFTNDALSLIPGMSSDITDKILTYSSHPIADIMRQAMSCPNCGNQGELVYFQNFYHQDVRTQCFFNHNKISTRIRNGFIKCPCALNHTVRNPYMATRYCSFLHHQDTFTNKLNQDPVYAATFWAQQNIIKQPTWLLKNQNGPKDPANIPTKYYTKIMLFEYCNKHNIPFKKNFSKSTLFKLIYPSLLMSADLIYKQKLLDAYRARRIVARARARIAELEARA